MKTLITKPLTYEEIRYFASCFVEVFNNAKETIEEYKGTRISSQEDILKIKKEALRQH